MELLNPCKNRKLGECDNYEIHIHLADRVEPCRSCRARKVWIASIEDTVERYIPEMGDDGKIYGSP